MTVAIIVMSDITIMRAVLHAVGYAGAITIIIIRVIITKGYARVVELACCNSISPQ